MTVLNVLTSYSPAQGLDKVLPVTLSSLHMHTHTPHIHTPTHPHTIPAHTPHLHTITHCTPAHPTPTHHTLTQPVIVLAHPGPTW